MMKIIKIYLFLLLIFTALSCMEDVSVPYKNVFFCEQLERIEYNTENFLKILKPGLQPGVFFTHKQSFFCYEPYFKDPSSICYVFQKSFHTASERKYGVGGCSKFFCNLRPEVEVPYFADIESHASTPLIVYETAINTDREDVRAEAIKIMGCKFKIHLQIKPEYLISFINSFCLLLYNDLRLWDIQLFKVIAPSFLNHVQSELFPIVVVYLPIFYESDSIKRSELLDSFIDAINDCYSEIVSEIAWTKTAPRFNHKINDLIYIAGSDGCFKATINDKLRSLENFKAAENYYSERVFKVFTPDFKFIRGFEYVSRDQRIRDDSDTERNELENRVFGNRIFETSERKAEEQAPTLVCPTPCRTPCEPQHLSILDDI